MQFSRAAQVLSEKYGASGKVRLHFSPLQLENLQPQMRFWLLRATVLWADTNTGTKALA